jgi:hypothetical protein
MLKMNEDILKQIHAEIDRRGGNVSSLDELNKIASEVTSRQNQKANPDFAGLSPEQMHLLLNHPFSERSSVGFKKVPEAYPFLDSPVMMACKTILCNIDSVKGLKLTQQGNLPRKVVSQIYDLPLFQEEDKTLKPARVPNELDYLPAAMAHALLRLSKIVKVRNNALQFTKEGKKYTQDNWQLFQSLFRTFATNYNKGYLDYYGENNIGNVGFLYVVYLLARFREAKHEADFYAGLYFKAFPDLTQEVRPILNSSSEEVAANCFKLRVFTRGLSMFGLIEMITLQKNIFIHKYQVRATPLFRKVFEIK